MATATRPLKVFIGYSNEDNAPARVLYETLRDGTLDVWFDQVDLVPGASSATQIAQALEASNVVAILIGRGSTSPSLQREAEAAVEHQAHNPDAQIIPILLPGSVPRDIPFELRRYPMVDLRREPLQRMGLTRLAARFTSDPDHGGPPGYELVGDRLRESGDPGEALTYYQKALEEHVTAETAADARNAVLHRKLGITLRQLGNLAQARRELELALAFNEELYGPDGFEVAADLNGLGIVLYGLGDLAGAKHRFERALAIWESTLGPSHPTVATDLGNLGNVLRAEGNFTEAGLYLERAKAIEESALGLDHPSVATGLDNLAAVLRDLGQPQEARPLQERALAITEATYGPDHPDVATRLNNLAAILRDLGQPQEARPLQERALAITEATYGPDHPDVATRLNNLAAILRDLGQPQEARPLQERALAITEATYGPDHPDVATRLNNLAVVLRDLGQPQEARPLQERALAITEATYGPDHPDVATRLNNLAVVLRDLGQPQEARPLQERALAITEAAYGPDHPDVATCLDNLAAILRDLGRSQSARPLQERALAITEAAYGPDHPDVATRLNNLTESVYDQDEITESTHSVVQRLEKDLLRLQKSLSAYAGVLIITSGPRFGALYELKSPITTIGRDPGSDVWLNEPTVSRRHAEVHRYGDNFTFHDLNSRNGSLRGNVQIRNSLLKSYDELTIGRLRLLFVQGEKAPERSQSPDDQPVHSLLIEDSIENTVDIEPVSLRSAVV